MADTTTNRSWTIPVQGSNPWYVSFLAFANEMDSDVHDAINKAGYSSSFTATAVDLVDAEDFTLLESPATATQGIGAQLTIVPSTATGQVTIELYQDSGRTQKVFEQVVDLTDSSTYKISVPFGFTNGTAGTLYGTLSTSGIPISQTANFSLAAQILTPTFSPPAITPVFGDGIEDNGSGLPRIALASSSGLTISGGDLAVKPDLTAAVYPSVNANGAVVTGAVATTTAQDVEGIKRFDSPGFVPRVATGAPVAGTWTAGTEVMDSDHVKWRCTTGGTPGTWELADTVTEETAVAISSAISQSGNELLKLAVTGNTGQAIWLKIWARRDSGTAEIDIPFRARIYQTSDKRGRELVWQGRGTARQTYLDTLLPASQTYLEVNDNDVADVDEMLCVYHDDDRYELGRCSGRTLTNFDVQEALVDASSWGVNTLVLPVSEWSCVPWHNTDGDPADQNNILLEIRHDGVATDPDLVFYAYALAQSRGVIR